ncbi:MAG: hypothetical protein KM310_08165 [Clostridiales bacterium]|nr:hypothetical protein [Clostridiales bacterium]
MARYLEKARKKGRVRPAGGTAAHTFLSLMVTGSRELRRQGIQERPKSWPMSTWTPTDGPWEKAS